MTQYRYKWVSARLSGNLDVAAMTRAASRGWEPVPYGQEPTDLPLPCEPDKIGNFILHRMPESMAQDREAELTFLNEALADSAVMTEIAKGNIRQHIADLRDAGTEVNPIWDLPNDIPADSLMAKKVKVAYDFLHSRGLA